MKDYLQMCTHNDRNININTPLKKKKEEILSFKRDIMSHERIIKIPVPRVIAG